MLTYEVYRYLIRTVHILLDDDSEIGTADPNLSSLAAVNNDIEIRVKENRPAELDQIVAKRRSAAENSKDETAR